MLLIAASVSHHIHAPLGPQIAARMAEPDLAALDPIDFKEVVSTEDAAAYHAAAAAQKQGNWQEANALMQQVSTPVLEPTLLAQWFLDARARPSEAAMNAWLIDYPTHPKYDAVLQRAAKLYPEAFAGLLAVPTDGETAPRPHNGLMASESTLRYGGTHTYGALPAAERSRVQNLVEQSDARMQAGQPLPSPTGLSTQGQDMVRWEQANMLFAYGNMPAALHSAGIAADRSTATTPAMHWVAGMAAWETHNFTVALHHFGAMARQHARLPAADSSAAAFWAARTAQVLNKREDAVQWLRFAATQRDTFYAQLARTALGQPKATASLLMAHTRLFSHGQADRKWLAAQPGAKRALAWHRMGNDKLAQWELAEAFTASGSVDRAILAHLAGALNFTDLQLSMAQSLPKELAVAASYPIPSWAPKSGFELDQALLLGITRQESGFNPAATSPAGASGLMQLMPQTAHYMAAMQPYAANGRAGGVVALRDPVTNLSLGQRYLQYLAAKPYVENNLILLLAAYNAGPKAAITWSDRAAVASDPLAFLERLSYSETRSYVQKVLANSWTYSALLGTEPESLSALAHGQWPLLKQGTPWKLAARSDAGTRKVN